MVPGHSPRKCNTAGDFPNIQVRFPEPFFSKGKSRMTYLWNNVVPRGVENKSGAGEGCERTPAGILCANTDLPPKSSHQEEQLSEGENIKNQMSRVCLKYLLHSSTRCVSVRRNELLPFLTTP